MLFYNKINVSEGIDINKSNKSKEGMICHYWYFVNLNFMYEPYICCGCPDITMMAYKLEHIAIMNAKCVDYRFVIWNLAGNNAINRLNDSKLDDKSSL